LLSTDKEPKDVIIEKIKVLYELGDDGRYEIIKRTLFVIESLLMLGKSSKSCVDFMMDKGVKPLELGIALSVAITRCKPQYLSKLDLEIKQKILDGNLDMLKDWEKLEKQNE